MKVMQIIDNVEKIKIARYILESLQLWFSNPDAREEYIKNSVKMIFLSAFDENRPVGFIGMQETGKDTIEISVMGVLEEYHRTGTGRSLFEHAKNIACESGYSFMQVKTLQMGRNVHYDKTNLFYQALGFKEFEIIPTLWNEENPCQIYVMSLGYDR